MVKLKAKTKDLTQISKSQEETKKAMLNVMEDLGEAKAIIEIEKAKDEAILASIADAVLACDKSGIISLFNKTAEELTGISAEEAIGHDYHQVITVVKESDGKPGNDFIAEAITNKKTTKMTNHALLIRKDGAKVAVSESAAPIINTDGTTIGCVVIFHDSTREREIDKVKSEFVSLASHQLRTPLTTINWSSEKLLSGASGKLSQSQQKEVKEAYDASKKMVSLIDALLNVSRLEMGTVSIEPELVNITEAASVCIKEFKPKISKKKLILQVKYDPSLTSFQTDPKLLNIILLNLLSNAVKYTPIGGKISLAFDKEKNNILITVIDSGIGIPQNQQNMIFTKLFRADNAQTIDPDGTGLGLYIVKAVTISLGGKISFESGEGKGTIFKVTLPLSGIAKKAGTKQLVSKNI